MTLELRRSGLSRTPLPRIKWQKEICTQFILLHQGKYPTLASRFLRIVPGSGRCVMYVRANLQRLNQRLLIVTSSIQWATAPSEDVLPLSAFFSAADPRTEIDIPALPQA